MLAGFLKSRLPSPPTIPARHQARRRGVRGHGGTCRVGISEGVNPVPRHHIPYIRAERRFSCFADLGFKFPAIHELLRLHVSLETGSCREVPKCRSAEELHNPQRMAHVMGQCFALLPELLEAVLQRYRPIRSCSMLSYKVNAGKDFLTFEHIGLSSHVAPSGESSELISPCSELLERLGDRHPVLCSCRAARCNSRRMSAT